MIPGIRSFSSDGFTGRAICSYRDGIGNEYTFTSVDYSEDGIINVKIYDGFMNMVHAVIWKGIWFSLCDRLCKRDLRVNKKSVLKSLRENE
jgi:hypothetical protein